MSNSAGRASASLITLTSELQHAKSSLSGYQSQLNRAKTLGDIEGYRKYSSLVNEAKRSVFGLAQEVDALGGPAVRSGEGMRLFTVDIAYVAEAAVKAAEKIADAGIEVVKFALEVTNTNKRLEATFTALGEGDAAGKQTLSMFNELSKTLPQSREQLAEWTKEFQAMGLNDIDTVRAHLVATAGAAAIMGESGAAAYIKLEEKARLASETQKGGSGLLKLGEKPLERLYKAGVNVTDIAKKMGVGVRQLAMGLEAGTVNAARFGEALESTLIEKGRGPLDAMMSSLDVLKRKGLETIGHLFDDIDTKPLTDAIQSVIDLGDQGEPSGQTLKEGITTGINGLIRALGYGITQGEIFFLKFEIFAVELEIRFKPLVHLLERLHILGSNLPEPAHASHGVEAPKLSGAIDTLDTALKLSTFVSPMVGSAYALGKAIVGGIEVGIRNDIDRIKAAGIDAGQAAIDGAKESTDTHSPSRVGFAIGRQVPIGLAMGMRSEERAPMRAGMGIGLSATEGIGIGYEPRRVEAPRLAGFSAESFRGMREESSGSGAKIETLNIHINAPHGVTDATAITVTGLTVALERMQLASGR